jgi:hypothetical protein
MAIEETDTRPTLIQPSRGRLNVNLWTAQVLLAAFCGLDPLAIGGWL